MMELILGADFSEMDKVHPWLMEAAEKHSIPDGTVNYLNLCLEEMVLNIMKYGYEDETLKDIEPKITVSMEWNGEQATLCIEDNAKAFNPLEHESRPTPTTLEETRIGGLGIELVKNFSESISYQRKNDLNHLTVVFKAE